MSISGNYQKVGSSNIEETISFTTKVADICGHSKVMLSRELYQQLKAMVGTLTINDTQIRLKDCTSVECLVSSSPVVQNLGANGAGALVSEELAKELSLHIGSQVQITNRLNARDVVLWNCGQDSSTSFGTYKVRKYVAKAFFVGCKQDPQGGDHPGIFLNDTQIKNLNLHAHLRPLCGFHKFQDLKAHSPQSHGIVKIYRNDRIIEAAVYESPDYKYPQSGILITPSLCAQLDDIQCGEPIKICSRFDIEGFEQAASLQSPPVVEKEAAVGSNTYLELFRSSLSHREIFTQLFQDTDAFTDADKLKLAELLDECTRRARELANEQEALIKFFNFIDIFGQFTYWTKDNQEYQALLKAVAQEIPPHQVRLLELLEQELLNTEYGNPPLLDALFTMGVNLKNAKGENCLHIMYRLMKGSTEKYRSYPSFLQWLKEKNLEGKTPLHYLCRNGDWQTLVVLGKKLRKFDPNDFVDPQGNPFHELAVHFSEEVGEKYLTVMQIVEHMGMSTLSWLDQTDHNGHTPLQKMASNGTPSLVRFFLFFCASDAANEEKIRKEILHTLLSQPESRIVRDALINSNDE